MSTRPWSLRATPLTFARVTMWSFIALLVAQTNADADLWGHLRFGLDMLRTHALQASDPYSFTADRAWVNHEWLSELLMGVAYSAFGAAGLSMLKLAVVAIVAGLGLAIARQEGARPIARDLFIALLIFSTYSRTQVVRPQMFSVAIFCALLYLLRAADRGRREALWGVPACFALWVNLHGGWIVGLAAFGVWSLVDIVTHDEMRERSRVVGIGVLTLGATLLNPYGIGLWQFLAATVRPDRNISDWAPLLKLPPPFLVIESVLPIVALAAVWRQRAWRTVGIGAAAVIALLFVATVRVGRIDAFLMLAMGTLLARQLVPFLNRVDASARGIFVRPSVAVGVLALALALYVGRAVAQAVPVVEVAGVVVPDRDAAAYLRERTPGARVLTWFDWGEYALWTLSPSGIRVSMDGRRETVYSERVIDDHFKFYDGRPDMVDYPDRIGADHVWLPSHFPMIEPLMRRGWVPVLDTGKSVILARSGAAGAPWVPRTSAADERPLFPWQ